MDELQANAPHFRQRQESCIVDLARRILGVILQLPGGLAAWESQQPVLEYNSTVKYLIKREIYIMVISCRGRLEMIAPRRRR